MAALETQVGQIFINNKKLSRSFISLFSEKAAETGAEIFILFEVGLLNPAAGAEYEKILRSITAIIRRNYKKTNDNSFENAIAQINDDLASTASQGQTSWVGKLNACIAVRQNESLAVATTGKIHAYLFREKQFSDIADSNSTKQNPLKAFENFALGKVAKKDFLIFTTNQLFNYVSIERLQKILSDLPIGAACKTIAELIKQLADESVSFGTFIVELGSAKDFSSEDSAKALNAAEAQKILGQVRAKVQTAFTGAKDFAAHTMMAAKQRSSKISVQAASLELLKNRAKIEETGSPKQLSRAKKFFFAAAIIFLILLAINIALALKIHYQKKSANDLNRKLTDIQQKISDANAAFLYNDQKSGNDLLNAAKTEFDSLPLGNKDIAKQANDISAEITALENSVGHVRTATAAKLFSYAGSQLDALRLAGNTLYAINFAGDLFIPYSLVNNAQQPEFTVPAPALTNAIYYNGNFIATDKSGNIYQINPAAKTAIKQIGSLPAGGIGLAAYGAPAKYYSLDPNGKMIMTATDASGPADYMPLNATHPVDLAVDGSIYILTPDAVKKFNSKQPRPFNSAASFSDGSKIYADRNSTYVYVLDPAKNKIFVLNKDSGAIVNQYASTLFKNLRNFTVDEKNKTIYVLDGQDILALKL